MAALRLYRCFFYPQREKTVIERSTKINSAVSKQEKNGTQGLKLFQGDIQFLTLFRFSNDILFLTVIVHLAFLRMRISIY